MADTKSILLVGVGGQGTILASKLLTIGLMEKGYDVKMSEIHGMAQRGGSVSSQVRYGAEVQSPVIELGDADILVSFEKMEALRWLEYLKPSGSVVVNDAQIDSTPILTGEASYPQDVIEEIEKAGVPVTVLDATAAALALGNPKVMNVILLGATVKSMALTDIDWEAIVRENVPAKLADLNVEALRTGMGLVQ
ncbi:MAG: indolepyruvate oxidoreductase subunit beta [Clostridiales Family XIII bacterium]|jgi:indolepyruvate ferredoxin oxidoreductase beta subunit|nr:indolepyruvate oxidoreductase subunit beta [Clostridiales Family XIII bacterium]